MSRIEITVNMNRLKVAAVEKHVVNAVRAAFPDASVTVRSVATAESRSNRFDEAVGLVGDAKSSAEELRDELQNWLDGMPENMQGGDKASQLEEAISSLDEFIDAAENAEGVSVEFPSMMG